ncbi:MAG: hypothetical protein KGJ13_01570 [Patescibacteria group bacterium]|nr:hypothetical protein [Patescibacteria group bacterium]
MSKTMTVGVVPIQHWHYMASMAEMNFEDVARGVFGPGDFPRGIATDISNFFDSVAEAIYQKLFGIVPSNPPASLQNYIYAKDALGNSMIPPGIFQISDAAIILLLFIEFFRHARCGGFTPESREMAGRLSVFFGSLARMAQ